VHNDAISSPKPPEQPTEERVGEMIGKILFLAALCLPSLGLFDNIARSVALTLTVVSRRRSSLAIFAAIRRASSR
jgi:hypothetical protein